MSRHPVDRRTFLATTAGTLGATTLGGCLDDLRTGAGVEPRWRVDTAGDGASVTHETGTVFVGSDGGVVASLDVETGEREWAVATEAITNPVSVVLGTVYAGSDRTVYALDATDGGREWRATVPRSLQFFTATRRRLFASADAITGAVYALSAVDGDLLWRFDHANETTVSMTVVDGAVVIAGGTPSDAPTLDDGGVYAVDVGTGEKRWSVSKTEYPLGHGDGDDRDGEESTEPGPHLQPAVVPADTDETVLVTDKDGIEGLDPETGDRRWRFEEGASIDPFGTVPTDGPAVAPGTAVGRPVVSDGRVFVGDAGAIHALDVATGGHEWTFEAPAAGAPTVPAGSEHVVSIGRPGTADDAAVLHTLDRSTGDHLWRVDIDAPGLVPPVVVEDLLVVGTVDDPGELLAFDATTGEQRWQFAGTGRRIRPTAAGSTVVAESDGSVYAFDPDQ